MYFIDDYEQYLLEKGVAKSTVSAYLSDVDDFEKYLKTVQKPLERAKTEDFKAYTEELINQGRSAATVNRRISSNRSFYDYLISRGALKKNPCNESKAGKVKEKDIVWLTEKEMEKLLDSPEDDIQGIRDRALLEMMYATGIRVSELCDLDVQDVDFNIGYISVNTKDKSKARVVPFR